MRNGAEVEEIEDIDLEHLSRADRLEGVIKLGLLPTKVGPQRELKLLLKVSDLKLVQLSVRKN